MKFNYLDAILLAGLLLGGYFGYRLGPLKKTITIGALIAGLIVGFRTMVPIGNVLAMTGLSLPAAAATAFVVVVAAVLACVIVLLRKFGKPGSSKAPGKIAATVLGTLEAALALSAILLVLKLNDTPRASTRENSLLYRPLVNLLPVGFDSLRQLLPGESEMRDEFSGGRDRGL
jgi:uncharacterized membrane protein required for colicin V production